MTLDGLLLVATPWRHGTSPRPEVLSPGMGVPQRLSPSLDLLDLEPQCLSFGQVRVKDHLFDRAASKPSLGQLIVEARRPHDLPDCPSPDDAEDELKVNLLCTVAALADVFDGSVDYDGIDIVFILHFLPQRGALLGSASRRDAQAYTPPFGKRLATRRPMS